MPADLDFIVADARIDLKQWNKAVSQMEADANRIEKLLVDPIEVRVNINDRGLRDIQQQLSGLEGTVNADVKFNAIGDDIEALRQAWSGTVNADVKFNVTGDDITSLRDTYDDTVDTKVKFTATGDDIDALTQVDDVTIKIKAEEAPSVDSTLKDIEGKLDTLKTLAKVQLVLDAASFVSDLGELPLVGSLLEIDQLTKQVMGRTGRDLEDVGRTINNVYTANWGDSKEEIAGVITTIAQLRDTTGDFLVEADNLESVAVGAFQAASVGGSEATEVLRAATQMVKNGFVPGFQDAFDIIASGYSRGFDQSGDFLDTLIEYSSTYSQLGLSANGFFNILRGGTESGVFNTDKMADAFKEMLNLTKEEVAVYKELGDETDRTRALNEAGLMDEATAYTAGEITGDEFSQAVIDTLVAQFDDPATQQRLAKAIFSPTMVEDAGLPALLQTNLSETNIWEGQAQNLSDEIFSGTSDIWATLQRTLETHFLEALMNSAEAQDFIDRLTIAAQRFGAELTSGATIGEALEIALEIPGLGDTLRQIESAFGNIAIVLLEVAASIGEAFGMEVQPLRDDIARFAEGQFVFDIQTAETADELAARMTSAINRGVEASSLADLTSQAVEERLQIGDIEGAQALVDAIAQVPDMAQMADNLSAEAAKAVQSLGVEGAISSLQMGLDLGLLQGAAKEQRQQDIALLKDMPLYDPSELQAQVDGYVTQLNTDLQTAVNAGDWDVAKTIGDQLGIMNIDQFISEQQNQAVIDALFPKPTSEDLNGYVLGLNANLYNALSTGDFEGASVLAEKLFPFEDPNVQSLIDDFATTLMVQFNNALNAGDTETADDILSILGLSPENNQIALDSMTQRLGQFAEDGGYHIDSLETDMKDLGGQMTETTDKGVEGVSKLYGSIVSETGVLGQERLKSLAKRFDAVADSIKSALEQIDNAEDKVGSGKIEGAAVGGIRGEGVTMVGETGREMIFSDERFAVLNNQTTERLFTALSGMASGGSVTNSRTVNYSPTIYVQNDAQAALFGSHALDQLRGNAY